jgi:hypothetical protein
MHGQVRSSGEWPPTDARARLRHVELRQTPTESSALLERRLAQLVRERQDLRDGGASQFVLEQNRLEIVRAQLELSQALVSEHLAVASA